MFICKQIAESWCTVIHRITYDDTSFLVAHIVGKAGILVLLKSDGGCTQVLYKAHVLYFNGHAFFSLEITKKCFIFTKFALFLSFYLNMVK